MLLKGSLRQAGSSIVLNDGATSQATLSTTNTAAATFSLPAATDTLVGRSSIDTLTNKTIDGVSNTITGITNAAIVASAGIPYSKLTLTGSIVNADVSASAAIAYSKLTLTGSVVNADVASGAAIAYSKLTLTGSIVNADVSAAAAIAYSKLNLAGAVKLASDVTGLLPTANGGTGVLSTATFPTSGVVVTEAGTETLTNKTLTAPVISSIVNTGTLTLPTATDTLVGRATTDTLTNKTLTAPVIASIVNTGTLTLPTSTDTLVGRATTDTLTNKTISGSSNTITNVSLTSGVTGTLPIGNGGTNVTSVTTAPVASAFAGWDANKNLSANAHVDAYTTTATAAGTTTLTAASARWQYFTGTTTQTVTLPVASTLAQGRSFKLVNNSTGVVTVQSSGGNTIQTMAASSYAEVTCILTSGTTAASWSANYSANNAGGGTVTSVGMTVPGILSVSGSPVTTSGTLAVSLATQSANVVFAGPSSGGAVAPAFRALVGADVPLANSTTQGALSNYTEVHYQNTATTIQWTDESGTNITNPATYDIRIERVGTVVVLLLSYSSVSATVGHTPAFTLPASMAPSGTAGTTIFAVAPGITNATTAGLGGFLIKNRSGTWRVELYKDTGAFTAFGTTATDSGGGYVTITWHVA